MSKTVKLADIASKLGVSVVTVSKALSGQKGVSEELRARIKSLADELGYVPSKSAKDHKKTPAKSYNIGVLIQESYLDKYGSFYWMMYQHVATHAMEKGSFTMLEVVSSQMEKALTLPKLLAGQKVDGIVVIGKLSEPYLVHLCDSSALPRIYMDFVDEKKTADAVLSDSFYGSYYLTNYLFSMGHTRIAYVGTVLATNSITDRYLGYSKSLMEHGQQYRPDWVIADRDMESGLIDEENLLQLPEDMPTAFFCNCDLTAGKLIAKLRRNGYRVPEDISVVGYDNYIHPDLCDIGITSYEVNLKEMAKRCVDTLLAKLDHAGQTAGIQIVEGRLVIKDSVRQLRVRPGQ